MSSHHRYACTLTRDQLPGRVAQVASLRDGLISHERDHRQLRLRFDPHLAELVDEFVRDESDCCSFYELTTQRTETATTLTVRAPAGADQLLTALHDAFTADHDSAT